VPCIYYTLADILNHFGSISSTGINDTLSFNETKTLLSNDKPIIIRWLWGSGDGHFLTITGYEGSGIWYVDPQYNSVQFGAYYWMVNSGQHTWTNTLRIDTKPPLLPYVFNNIGDAFQDIVNIGVSGHREQSISKENLKRSSFVDKKGQHPIMKYL
jgi:hypothetical protein